MKLMHLSDLHLGKRLNELSLFEDQKYILEQIVEMVRAERPAAVLLAGDIYDKSVPPVEAVQLFDSFLTQLAELGTVVCCISGNHDSAERLSFGAELMRRGGVYFTSCYDGAPQLVRLEDEQGMVNIYLLPFLKPIIVNHALNLEGDERVNSYQEALALAVERLRLNTAERNVLVAHQFITGAKQCESESVVVGGLDNIGAEVFAAFDYVALGHIHSPQNITEKMRYSGTPLKYSFSEVQQEKSVTIVELGAKGDFVGRALPLKPLHDLRSERGTYDELMARSFYQNFPMDTDGRLADYYQLILTDEQEVTDAAAKLRSVYKNLLQLSYDNKRTRADKNLQAVEQVEHKSKLELLQEFYTKQNNQELAQAQADYLTQLLEEMEGKA